MSLSTNGAPPFSSRKYDLVIYGATGFTGQLAVEYVHKTYPQLKFAMAGRNKAKLEKVRAQVCGPDSTVPVLVADAVNPEHQQALHDIVKNAKVVANYAGTPFVDKALPVVEACTRFGTCYTDITGEAPFQRVSYDRYNKEAKKSGALIMHACGYDSVPSDLGALLAATEMKKRHGCDCKSLEMVVGDSNGGASGGTIHTVMELLFGDTKGMPGMKECQARGSYGLDPDGGVGGLDTSDSVLFVSYDKVAKSWVVPFLMAAANAPVVRKTNALFGYKYGKSCTYREVQAVPNMLVGVAGMLAFGVFGALIALPPTRWLLLKYVLPKPGEGPSRDLQEAGYFANYVYAVGDKKDAPVVKSFVKSGNAGDPGYKATARMSIESSLCAALQRDQCHKEGGVLTPAFGLGMTLVDRLNASGMELGVEAAPSP